MPQEPANADPAAPRAEPDAGRAATTPSSPKAPASAPRRAKAEPDGFDPAVRRVVGAGVALLGADGAAVMVLDKDREQLRTVVAGRLGTMLETAGDQLWAGPCLEAVTSRGLVQTTGLGFERRWPGLGLVAAEHAVHGLASVPLELGDGLVGTFTVVRTAERPWEPAETTAIELFAEVVGILTRSVAVAAAGAELAGQLEHALRHRVVIEQAKGMLMERERMSPDEAFDHLRRSARASRRRVTEVALDMVAGRAPQDPRPPS